MTPEEKRLFREAAQGCFARGLIQILPPAPMGRKSSSMPYTWSRKKKPYTDDERKQLNSLRANLSEARRKGRDTWNFKQRIEVIMAAAEAIGSDFLAVSRFSIHPQRIEIKP